MREYWEENLHALKRVELIERLNKISQVFNSLPIREDYDEDQLYFMAEEGYTSIKIGLSKSPFERLKQLQASHPHKIRLLYFYDPAAQQRKLEDAVPNVRVHPKYQSPGGARIQEIKWLNIHGSPSTDSWAYPDERALRILIKKGMINLKELMTELGLDYSSA